MRRGELLPSSSDHYGATVLEPVHLQVTVLAGMERSSITKARASGDSSWQAAPAVIKERKRTGHS